MTANLKTALVVLVTSSSLALAQGVQAADSPESAPKAEAGTTDLPMSAMPMHKQMKRMHDQRAKMMQAEDPQSRRELMREHMASMQGMMQMMHGMMAGQGAMGRGRHGAMPHGGARDPMGNPPCVDSANGDWRAGMEQRMNMMQMMMDDMLENQAELLDEE